jgi:NADH-quinone oxidoreductase subunit M
VTLATALLAFLAFAPLVGALLVRATRTARAAVRIGIGTNVLVVPTAFALFVATRSGTLGHAGLGFAIDGLSAVLLPLVAALVACVLGAAPRADLDRRAVAFLLLVESGTLGSLVATHVVLLLAFWALAFVPLALESRGGGAGAAVLRRALALVVVTAIAPLAVALGAAAWLGLRGGVVHPFDAFSLAESELFAGRHPWIGGLVLLAGAARMGMFPLHLWAPAVLARGRAPWAIPLVISPLGSFVIVRFGLTFSPTVFARALPAIVGLGAISAAYGALLAVGQHDARRMLGHVWVSLVGFVLVGFASLDARGTSGALFHAFATVIAMTGLALVVRSIEARTGTADLRRLGGLARRAPRLGIAFFLLALACVGFPGAATFVSEDLVVHGLVGGHAAAALTLLIATALNGVSLLRAHKRIFLGPTSAHAPSDFARVDDMLPRERWVALVLVAALLAGGLVPSPLLAVREGVVGAAAKTGR